MARRMRFTADEKKAFTEGTVVEWQNGAHWHEGVVVDAPARDAEFGWWRVGVRNTGGNTRTVSPGAYITGEPGKVRLPQ